MKKYVVIASMIVTAATQLFAQSLNVSVHGLRENIGQLMVFVYDNADAFPTKRDKAFRLKKIPVTASPMAISFDNVPPGTYGIAVYHDENNNDKMDRHWYGPPKEGYGASNDAQGTFGPPSFDDAKFKFQRSQDTIKIIIHY
jgi:uncharacterized protein (DUF2141 family)